MKNIILALVFTALSGCLCAASLDRSYGKKLNELYADALLNMIDHLIDINCVNAKNGDGLTVLHTCVYRDDLVCVKKLLENGADPNIKNRFDNTALQIAENGNANVTAVIKAHLNNPNRTVAADEKPCELNSTQWDQIYFDTYKPALAQIVIDGAMNLQDEKNNGQTLLHTCVIMNKMLWTKFLVERGADPSIRDYYGRTALDYANQKYGSNHEIVNLLTNAVQSTTQQPSTKE